MNNETEKLLKQRARKIILIWGSAILAFIAFLWILNPIGFFSFNGTSSLDGTLFFVLRDVPPERGKLAAFHPKEGNLYPSQMWFGKVVAGVPGDIVTVQERSFFINGKYIGTAKRESSGGKPLEMSAPGRIPDGYYFMWTDHEDSYDSRYSDIGWIHESAIFGRLYRIF